MLAKGWGDTPSCVPASIQADNGAGLTAGIIGLMNKGQPRKLDDWGALRAWAWGASRALDYFETDKAVDAKQRRASKGTRVTARRPSSRWRYDPAFRHRLRQFLGEGGVKLHRRNWGELVENVAAPTSTTGWRAIS